MMMVNADTLRLLATLCSVGGSVLLAWRVKRILDALTLVVGVHDLNIQQLMPGQSGDIYNLSNSTAHLDRAKGTRLLVFGFLLLAASGGLNLWALCL